MLTLKSAWTIAKKDLRLYYRDRMALLLGFLLPIVLITTFGLIMGQTGSGGGAMPKVVLWVADRDRSDASELLIASLRQSEMLRILPAARDDQDVADRPPIDPEQLQSIESKVADGDASHVLVIEPGFESIVENGQDGGLRLIGDPGRELEERLISLGITQAMFTVRDGDYWSVMLSRQFAEAGMPADALSEFTEQASGMSDVIQRWVDTTDEDPFETGQGNAMGMFGNADTFTREEVMPPNRPKKVTFQLAQSVSGVTVMMLMFGLSSCGVTLLTERDAGTMARLLSASVPRNSILLGKVMFTLVVGMSQMLVLLVYGELIFGIGILRDPFTLFTIAAVWTLAATSFGILIASFSKSPKQAESITPIVSLSLAALGGCWFPLQLLELPTWVDALTKSTPTYWAMSGFQGYFWDGLGLASSKILFAIAIQLAFAITMIVIASVLFRRNFLRG